MEYSNTESVAVRINTVKSSDRELIDEIVTIHLKTFTGFFLTFMGRGFLFQMYRSYCEDQNSSILVAEIDEKPVGFLAYSSDLSELYKFMIKKRLVPFAWYSGLAFIRRPKALFHILRAFMKPSESKRSERYVELASIGVDPASKLKGIGSALMDELKRKVDFQIYKYITLETDADNNDVAVKFYEKHGFVRERRFTTPEGRNMFEYRFYGHDLK